MSDKPWKLIRPILLEYWDPMGVRDEPLAQDEYDDYVFKVLKAARGPDAAVQIAATLTEIEDELGVGSDRPKSEIASLILNALRKA